MKNLRLLALSFTMLLASCFGPPAAPPPGAPAVPPPGPQASVAPDAAPSPPGPIAPPRTLDGYKKAFSRRVAGASLDVFEEPLPEVLKSIVVLDVTIDGSGRLVRVTVARSNHYRELENVALSSVRQAAPFAAPFGSVRRSDGSVNFLETFLFREDGRFQILSLVTPRQ